MRDGSEPLSDPCQPTGPWAMIMNGWFKLLSLGWVVLQQWLAKASERRRDYLQMGRKLLLCSTLVAQEPWRSLTEPLEKHDERTDQQAVSGKDRGGDSQPARSLTGSLFSPGHSLEVS